ncbi:MAG TPA: SCO family protein [Pyrinomonadaceae bacterium]|nr:SCO family protein [Pyrinomonadaceae bacterium]
MKKSLLCLLLIICLFFAASCRRSSVNEKRFELKGKVVSVDRDKSQVTISHEAVTGYMPAMTMPFTVSETDLQILAPEDQVVATLVVDGSKSRLEDLVISRQSGNAAAMPAVVVAKQGDEVPNFTLRNQDDREIRIHNYRGKALLLTFVYTRCPMPDQCTLMSTNFAQVDRDLGQDAELYAKTHLLSVSIDPEYDTPKVLRSYGAAHTGRYDKETFAHWEFAAGTKDQVKEIAQFFGMNYYPGNDQIIHALRTVIVAPDGKVAKIFTGNEWKPEEAMDALRQSLASQD